MGIDLIEIARVRRVHGEYPARFVERILTPHEREYVARYADPVPRIAGRFAAKEACMKALGTGWGAGVRWRDVEVVRNPRGKPEIQLHGRAKEICALLGGTVVHCTITHTDDQAMAMVVIE
ncbi:MAG: holo-ACP synthase [Candidatus Latescibacteria bacterium]|nr:holo-ACP synthase [Candidatus Latescibacterota bacterium]